MDWDNLKDRVSTYGRLMRLHRPIGTLLLLWPVLWSLWIASGGAPDTKVLLVFILGTFTMRSAGCVINDFADRDIDAHVERTRDRPFATNAVSVKEALILFLVLIVISASLVATMNRLTIYLSFLGVMLAIIYPFTKRYVYIPQIFLGCAFGWGVPMAFAAQTNSIPNLAWAVMATAVLWAIIYDTEYAMVDRESDISLGLKSTAILFDEFDRYFLGVFQIMMLLGLGLIGREAHLGWPFAVSLIICGGMAAYQQTLVYQREPAKCFKAFMNNNWYGLVVFFGIAASYWNAN
ncbi:MAG TPA: 4-hydroxybenzoate octaprenyltransferase [Gammaproteobacteria bacterium]|nr:4-hydroxybenzoate octaprenyltransferase [Gammaproteobacteria bacterium]|tara:strand:+ start:997 stop:1872 length:876 start_codon:yes stop_codon:yes gene_type:complete